MSIEDNVRVLEDASVYVELTRREKGATEARVFYCSWPNAGNHEWICDGFFDDDGYLRVTEKDDGVSRHVLMAIVSRAQERFHIDAARLDSDGRRQ